MRTRYGFAYQVGNYSIPRGSAVFLVPDSTNVRPCATNKRRIIVNDDPRYCTPMMKARVSGFQARVHVCRYGNDSRLLACASLTPWGRSQISFDIKTRRSRNYIIILFTFYLGCLERIIDNFSLYDDKVDTD